MSKGKGTFGLDRLRGGVKRLLQGVENARSIMQQQRELEPYAAPYEQALTEGILKLRHYTPQPSPPDDVQTQPDEHITIPGPLLFVPPLMVTAEIYDISPELSAVAWLQQRGIDVWLADFGRPEQEDGWDRTLDDHVIAVDRAIEAVAELTGKPVHLAGYSQGGMFAYQAAAYRKGADIASLITFGSPVDLRRNMPIKIHEALAERFFSVAQSMLKAPIRELRGLPGILNSYGFKLVSPRQEIKHLLKVMGMMHDEEALKRVLPTRRFLGGEGFIAWPGPALRKFLDEYIVNNRLLSGGFVINGKSASLADLEVPILCVVGEKDEIAKPAAVRAIHKAVLHDEIYELPVQAGHFGLVVGSTALAEVWPMVASWIAWRAGTGPKPHFPTQHDHPTEQDTGETSPQLPQDTNDDDTPQAPRHLGTAVSSWKPLRDLATEIAGGAWQQLGEVSLGVTDVLHTMRWQLPRMAKVLSMDDNARTNMGRMLARQAEAIPDVDFFFWGERVHTYAEANRWVDQLAFQLHQYGLRARHRIAIAMEYHPGYLLVAAALSRLGAVPVLLPSPLPHQEEGAQDEALASLMRSCDVRGTLVDRHNLPRWQRAQALLKTPEEKATHGTSYLLMPQLPTRPNETAPEGVHPLSLSLTPGDEVPVWPDDFVPNPGLASDLAMILFTAGTSGPPKAVQISNRRWRVAALATAASCTLHPKDTVYCSVPYHQSAGFLLNVGGALSSGARVLLAPAFSPVQFWQDVRRLGVTVAFYTGTQAREILMAAPENAGGNRHSLRLLAGNGIDEETWRALEERYEGLSIVEFYGTAEGNVALVNPQGVPVGSVGKPLVGEESDLALVQYDFSTRQLLRDESGRCIECLDGGPGVLMSRVDRINAPLHFAPYVDPTLSDENMIRNAFTDGDAWFVSGDWMRRDDLGHYYFIDALANVDIKEGVYVSTRQVGHALQQYPGVRVAAARFFTPQEAQTTHASGLLGLLELPEEDAFDGTAMARMLDDALPKAAHPQMLAILPALARNTHFQIDIDAYDVSEISHWHAQPSLYEYDDDTRAYQLVQKDSSNDPKGQNK